MKDLEKLADYGAISEELHELSRETGIGHWSKFEHLEIRIQPDAVICVRLYNDENSVVSEDKFPFSMVEQFADNHREKIKYRKKQKDESQ